MVAQTQERAIFKTCAALQVNLRKSREELLAIAPRGLLSLKVDR
jgi:hypothetical protein